VLTQAVVEPVTFPLTPQGQTGDPGHLDQIPEDLLGDLLVDRVALDVRGSVHKLVVSSAEQDQVGLDVIGKSTPVTDMVKIGPLIGPAAPAAPMPVTIPDACRKRGIETLVARHSGAAMPANHQLLTQRVGVGDGHPDLLHR
jgi:hypothetical protein